MRKISVRLEAVTPVFLGGADPQMGGSDETR
jgi:hypothetical protein